MTTTYQDLKQIQLIPVLRKIPFETSEHLIQALVDGGIKAIEVTMDTENAAQIIEQSVARFGDQLLVGAGTVLSVEDCDQAIEAGAQFIVSPSYNQAVVEKTLAQSIPVIPGVFTPSEMYRAYENGAQIVKLFPASAVGPGFVKDVKGPLQHIDIMTTGGITLENAKSYLKAGAITVGAGSDLLNKTHIQNQDWAAITSIAKQWVHLLENDEA